SGARLIEVGATNKVRLADYQAAITEETALLLRVHPSNFQLVGFTEEVPLPALARLGRERGVPVMDDLGSGARIDLTRHGLEAAVPSRAAATRHRPGERVGFPGAGHLASRRGLASRRAAADHARGGSAGIDRGGGAGAAPPDGRAAGLRPAPA